MSVTNCVRLCLCYLSHVCHVETTRYSRLAGVVLLMKKPVCYNRMSFFDYFVFCDFVMYHPPASDSFYCTSYYRAVRALLFLSHSCPLHVVCIPGRPRRDPVV
jgi:hypothetical protein